MTDNEIIKALECCTNPKVGEICPRANFADVCTDGCVQVLVVQTLDLINRIQAENEDLKKVIETMTNKDLRLAIDFKARIDKLKAENLELLNMCAEQGEKAIKEFAERLHDIFVSKVQKYYCKVKEEHSFKFLEGYLVDDVLSNIDYVKKEMVGDDND
jgi:hypothetical protein